ncbi:MAG TPA: hypothetical protein PKH07_06810, partial [bacterium]|nr:hypothetical protein [bacterium]
SFVDENTTVFDWAMPNRNDDWDFWVDLNADSVFTPGVDPVVIDVNANGIADVNDHVMFEGNVFGSTLQLVGKNDDEDAWFGDYPRVPESSRVFWPRVDEVIKEDEGEGNIWANTKGYYDGTSLDETQIGDEVLFFGAQANLDAYGNEVSDAAEDDRTTPTTEWSSQWVNADFWTATYNRTQPDSAFAATRAFFDHVENGYYLTMTDPVVVIRDSGSVKGVIDTGDRLISYPGSSSNPLPLNNVNNLANRFLLMKGINVRGLNDDYLVNHPRTDGGIADLFAGNPALLTQAETLLANPIAQAALGISDPTEFFRIPIGDAYLERGTNAPGFDAGVDEIWIDINLDGRLTIADVNGCERFPGLRPPSSGTFTQVADTTNLALSQLRDVISSNSNLFLEESEERYNGIDDDGDGYVDEDCSDFRLFLLIDEDDYDFYVDTDGVSPFDPNTDPYYVDLNADGVYQEGEWVNADDLGISDPLSFDVEYLLQAGIVRLDNDSDGRENEDPKRRVGNDPNVTLKPIHAELIDEDGLDLFDNDGDGLIDEDCWFVPLFPLVDEERLDYFVDQEGGVPGVFNNGIDEYYVDLNGNGLYDPIVAYFKGGYYRQEKECVYPGRDGTPDIPAGFAFNVLMGVDNDRDGLVNEDVRDPNMQIYDFDSNYSDDRQDGFQLWADTDGNGRFDRTVDTIISNGYSWQRILPSGVPTNTADFSNGINEDYLVRVSVDTNRTACIVPITDDGNFDFFMVIRTDSGDSGGAPSGADKEGDTKELKLADLSIFGVDWGDDFSLQAVTDGVRVILNNNSARGGMSIAQEQTKRQPCLFYAADVLGFYGTTPNNVFDDDDDGVVSEEYLNGLDDDGDGEDDDGNPLTPARADGLDNNNNGFIDEGIDKDYRHLFANNLDDDGDGEPGSPVDFFTGKMMADGIDNNGDGRIDEGIDEEIPNGYDDDGDGEDDDGNPFTRARADGIDNDGDGLIDEGIDEDCGDYGVGHASTHGSVQGYWGGWQPEAVHQFGGIPYVDATSAPIPLLGLNVT